MSGSKYTTIDIDSEKLVFGSNNVVNCFSKSVSHSCMKNSAISDSAFAGSKYERAIILKEVRDALFVSSLSSPWAYKMHKFILDHKKQHTYK